MATDLTHIPVKGSLDIDLSKAFTMQGLFESVQLAYPKDPSLSIVGIALPVIGLECKEFGIINPISDIKEAIARLYDYSMTAVLKPIWNTLHSLYSLLKKFGLPELDLKLPILDLHISDLFASNLYDRLKLAITDLYNTSKEKLQTILKALSIPLELFVDYRSPEIEIEALIKHIKSSLLDSLVKLIAKVIGYIKTGLLAWDIATKGLPVPLAPLFAAAVDAVLAKILKLIALPPSIQDIYDAIMAYAKAVYDKIPTYDEILAIIEKFKLPIFGFPLDWKLPININVKIPNVDFVQILGDMKLWMNNFLVSLLQKFVQAIAKILSVFKIVFEIPKIHIPFTLCAVKTT